MSAEPTGIIKRRYEVRFVEGEDDEAKPLPVLGWHDTVEGAARMAKAWKLRPNVSSVWVVDLEAQDGGDYAER